MEGDVMGMYHETWKFAHISEYIMRTNLLTLSFEKHRKNKQRAAILKVWASTVNIFHNSMNPAMALKLIAKKYIKQLYL